MHAWLTLRGYLSLPESEDRLGGVNQWTREREHLIAKHDKGKVVWVSGAGLDQELVSPAVEGLEGVGRRDVVCENATVCPAIESHSK